jgi:hypothetical protein
MTESAHCQRLIEPCSNFLKAMLGTVLTKLTAEKNNLCLNLTPMGRCPTDSSGKKHFGATPQQ